MTIVGNPKAVVGGVDTLDVHVAVAVDHFGGILGVESFEVTEAGYRRLSAWLAGLGELALAGVEGTGSYGAGLTRYLHQIGSRSSKSIGPTVRAGIGTVSPTKSMR